MPDPKLPADFRRLLQRVADLERRNSALRGRRTIDTGKPISGRDYIRRMDLDAAIATVVKNIPRGTVTTGATSGGGTGGGGGGGGGGGDCHPSHPMGLGYWLADGRYGDYYSAVKTYTDTFVAWWGDRQYVDNSATPPDVMAARFKLAVERAFADGMKLYIIADADVAPGYASIEMLLDILASVPTLPAGNSQPLWSAVKWVDIADEPPVTWEENINLLSDAIQSFAAGIAARLGPGAPNTALYGVTLSVPQTLETALPTANLVQFVGVEMYALRADFGNDVNEIQPYLASLYSNFQGAVPPQRSLFPIMQAYDRNGDFVANNPEHVAMMVEIQSVTYNLCKDDPRALGITMFNYGRPNPGAGGGTFAYPELKAAHQEISSCIFTGTAIPTAQKLSRAAGASGSMAFSDG